MRKLTYEIVYEKIKQRIKEGLWKPGDQIPTVQQLAEELGVGISSVREAIRILGNQNILKVEQGRGTFIMNVPEEDSLSSFGFLEDATMIQLTEARQVIEPELAALSAEHATKEEVKAILQAAKGMNRKAKLNEDFLKEDMLFHYLIAKASKNEIIFQMFNMISDLIVASRRRTLKMKGMTEKATHYHILIAEAIAQRNPTQARNLMKAHIDDVIYELTKDIN
ncbi:FadR/GntR family transcriptional regulator [Ammoniphilus resinae]|uniref:GntR family transcriptional repressor for pyruvate dehydrogenase complex n=1 Tax=Ammoniphilus resinae TaxID=861532 RepID=A0ABS4GIQ8_9BACL|nr:FadR/GntR family transcriptional regulator [Ammoniphilus resinae]MBP1930141.1 GntR family transcriptional repressor for pyruvate dehydrogenase complex [Ammoniphilus resinae]